MILLTFSIISKKFFYFRKIILEWYLHSKNRKCKEVIYLEENKFITLKEAAHYLNINERTMKHILMKNKANLTFQKIGGKYLIDKQVLTNLLNSKSFVY